jgi:hypothetical protein
MLTPKQRQALDESIIGDMWIDSVAERAGFTREEIEPIVSAIFKKIPAKTVDYDAILENDPIACDPLIVQGQISILRLDDIYKIAHRHFFYSQESQKLKIKTTKTGPQARFCMPNIVDGGDIVEHSPHGSSQRLEETTAVNYEGIKYLELAMRAIDRGFKTQITITRRTEKLQRRAERRARGELDPIPAKKDPSKKPKNEHRDRDYDRGVEGIRGYPDSDPPTNSNGSSANNGHSNGRANSASEGRNNSASGGRKSPEVSALLPTHLSAPPRDTDLETANTAPQQSREAEPVVSEFAELSATPRETLFAKDQPFHKRE